MRGTKRLVVVLRLIPADECYSEWNIMNMKGLAQSLPDNLPPLALTSGLSLTLKHKSRQEIICKIHIRLHYWGSYINVCFDNTQYPVQKNRPNINSRANTRRLSYQLKFSAVRIELN